MSSRSYSKTNAATSSSIRATKDGTKLIRDTFKGNATIGIWDVDAKGNTIGKAPIISFGYNKVKAIVDHMEEIRVWAAEQEEEKELAKAAKAAAGQQEDNRIKVEDLSPADLAAIQAILNKSKGKN